MDGFCLKGCVAARNRGLGIFKPFQNQINLTESLAMLSPWVALWVDGEDWILTSGNRSSGRNEACIKSFNYGESNGFGCTIEVVDESGGNFTRFFNRLKKSNVTAADQAIKLRWGYNLQSQFGNVISGANVPITNHTRINTLPNPNVEIYSSTIHNLFINGIECKAESASTFKYIINAIDLYSANQATLENRIFGSDQEGVYLTVAIRSLLATYGMTARFIQTDSAGNTSPLLFDVPNNPCSANALGAVVGATAFQLNNALQNDPIRKKMLGPCRKWECGNKSIVSILRDWLNKVKTDDGKAILMKYTSLGTGSEIIFYKDNRDPCNPYKPDTILGTYIVNGGRCSPVISFEPNFKMIYQNVQTASAAPANNGTPTPPNSNNGLNSTCNALGALAGGAAIGATAARMYNSRNTGVPQFIPAVGQGDIILWGQDAGRKIMEANLAAKYSGVLFTPIEAELRIQGNPAYEFPVLDNFYSLNIVYLNPYRPIGLVDASTQRTITEWYQGDQLVGALSADNCNPILSNSQWMIMGISHDIRDGIYQTIIKLRLNFTGFDIPPGFNLGGSPDGAKVIL